MVAPSTMGLIKLYRPTFINNVTDYLLKSSLHSQYILCRAFVSMRDCLKVIFLTSPHTQSAGQTNQMQYYLQLFITKGYIRNQDRRRNNSTIHQLSLM
ncbi:hypothetical protein MATL_G00239790 [Megalops atlanticus]|uniref:Uncharacterized protein n=1 Tax=Megalops atlanticus TaxID=7932 RepID=A0A9D3SXB2_MEGAT|nr:hypothetical protein MATL_G00239790 [Megalops atlanticus]